jgi:hypothetical protein
MTRDAIGRMNKQKRHHERTVTASARGSTRSPEWTFQESPPASFHLQSNKKSGIRYVQRSSHVAGAFQTDPAIVRFEEFSDSIHVPQTDIFPVQGQYTATPLCVTPPRMRSSPNGSNYFAGSRFGDAPSPTILPPPPQHWISSNMTCKEEASRLVDVTSVPCVMSARDQCCNGLTSGLKVLLHVQ